mgnify:CR=1 FL=1
MSSLSIVDFSKYCKVSDKTVRRGIKRLELDNEQLFKMYIDKEKIKTGFKYGINEKYKSDFRKIILQDRQVSYTKHTHDKLKPQNRALESVKNDVQSEVLQAVIDEKDKQLAMLQEQLKAKDEQLDKLDRKLEFAMGNNKQLQDKLLMIEDKKRKRGLFSWFRK